MNDACDKCGRLVPPENDATTFAREVGEYEGAIVLIKNRRHLLPVVEDEKVVCPGSPSRAQYLPGQPHQEGYEPSLEPHYRAAYERWRNRVMDEQAEHVAVRGVD